MVSVSVNSTTIHNLWIARNHPNFPLKKKTKKMAHTITTTTTLTTMATTLNPLKPTLSSFKPNISSSFSCKDKEEPKSHSCVQHQSISATTTTTKRRFLDMGVGLLAASMVVASPLDADATRIEYYATVADPPCEFKFAPSGLGYCDISVGSGVDAPYAELINVHYTARFADGIVFDSTYKRARPLTMRIGVGKVIRGLDQGIFGGEGVPPMQVGGKRKLQIPPELAYGPEPAGCFSGDCNIPGNATLVYDINFVGIYLGNRKLL